MIKEKNLLLKKLFLSTKAVNIPIPISNTLLVVKKKFGSDEIEELDLVEQGYHQLEDGLVDEALVTFNDAIKKDQKNDLAHSGVISCYIKMSKMQEAKTYLEKLSDDMKKKPEILKLIAKIGVLENQDVHVLNKEVANV